MSGYVRYFATNFEPELHSRRPRGRTNNLLPSIAADDAEVKSPRPTLYIFEELNDTQPAHEQAATSVNTLPGCQNDGYQDIGHTESHGPSCFVSQLHIRFEGLMYDHKIHEMGVLQDSLI